MDDQTPLVQIRVEVGNTYLPAAITLHKEAEVIRTTEANGEVLRTLHSEPGEGFVFGLFSERDIHENGVTLLGANPETIDKAEDRQMFKDTMENSGFRQYK